MSSESEETSQKYLPPSPKKLRDAFSKGRVIFSREVYNLFTLFAALISIFFIIPYVAKYSIKLLKGIIVQAFDGDFSYISLYTTMMYAIYISCILLFPVFLVIVISILLANFIHHGKFNFTFSRLAVDFNYLSPTSGLKKLFSTQTLFELVKNIVKVLFLALILIFVFFYFYKILISFPANSFEYVLNNFLISIKSMLGITCIFMCILATIDYSYYKHKYFKSLMMSRREMRDELKDTEGTSNIVKSKILSQSNKVQDRFKFAIQNASCLITDEKDGVVVAIEYTKDKSSSPIVIAKARQILGMQLKNIAINNAIPVIKNVKLAQNLYTNVNVYQEIPQAFFKDIARILASLSKK